MEPEKKTIDSWDDIDSNLFFDSLNGMSVIIWIALMNPLTNFVDVFIPVPTAVPPCAR